MAAARRICPRTMAEFWQKSVNAGKGIRLSLSALEEAIIPVRADRIEGGKDHRALGQAFQERDRR